MLGVSGIQVCHMLTTSVRLQVVTEQKTDIVIVGRGILQASDPVVAARQYQEKAFAAYLKTL